MDLGAVEKSLQEVVRRHEVLRTRIVSVEGKPEQVIEEEVKLRLVVEEVGGKEEAERVCRAEAERPFDLSAGPLRVRLLRVAGEQGYVLMVTMHHIVSDGWSLGILLRELGELYEGYARGSGVKLEELGIQYGDFAEWQREWLQGEVLEEQVGVLAGAVAWDGDAAAADGPGATGGAELPGWRAGAGVKQGAE